MKQFKCQMCEGVFDMAWTDEEAQTELKEEFPGFKPEDCGIVCDNCYNTLMGK